MCAGEHLLDESIKHKVVPIRQKGFGLDYLNCLKHTKLQCELHCEQCDLPICTQCVFSEAHLGHKAIDIMKIFDTKKEILKKYLHELESSLIPRYHEIKETIPIQEAELEKKIKSLTTAICKRGDEWHREIDRIINERKLKIKNMRNRSVAPFFTEKVEFALSISCITDTIVNRKKLLDSNDVYLVSKYKSKNDRYRKLPPYFRVKFSCFSSKTINADLLKQQFGVLSAFSFESQK